MHLFDRARYDLRIQIGITKEFLLKQTSDSDNLTFLNDVTMYSELCKIIFIHFIFWVMKSKAIKKVDYLIFFGLNKWNVHDSIDDAQHFECYFNEKRQREKRSALRSFATTQIHVLHIIYTIQLHLITLHCIVPSLKCIHIRGWKSEAEHRSFRFSRYDFMVHKHRI